MDKREQLSYKTFSVAFHRHRALAPPGWQMPNYRITESEIVEIETQSARNLTH